MRRFKIFSSYHSTNTPPPTIRISSFNDLICSSILPIIMNRRSIIKFRSRIDLIDWLSDWLTPQDAIQTLDAKSSFSDHTAALCSPISRSNVPILPSNCNFWSFMTFFNRFRSELIRVFRYFLESSCTNKRVPVREYITFHSLLAPGHKPRISIIHLCTLFEKIFINNNCLNKNITKLIVTFFYYSNFINYLLICTFTHMFGCMCERGVVQVLSRFVI